MADTNIEKQSDEENDVIEIDLDNSLNVGKEDTIEESLEKSESSEEEKRVETQQPAFTNPIYGETQDIVAHVETEKVTEDYFPADRQPPLDRLLKHVTKVDVSYNTHSALDRVLKSVEDTESGDETSKLIKKEDGAEQYKKPIDRAVTSIRHNPEPNLKHPIDRAFATVTQDPNKSTHPVAERIAVKVNQDSPVNPIHPIDRLAGYYPTPKSVKTLGHVVE